MKDIALPFDVTTEPRFDGHEYRATDRERLTGQILRVFDATKDGRYRTVEEIARLTGDPETSVSAQLRNLRKQRFGGHQVSKRRRGGDGSALWEFSVTPRT